MMTNLPYADLWLLLFVIIIILWPFIIHLDAQRRKKRIEGYKKYGFSPIDQYKFGAWAHLYNFSMLTKLGIVYSDYDHVIGQYKGYRMGLFEYYADRRHQTVTIIELKKKLPYFVLRPEWIRDKIKTTLGKNDIDFDNNKTFSKKYFLQGNQEAVIRGLFKPHVLSYFCKQDRFWVECDGSKLLIFKEYDFVRNVDNELREFLDRAVHICNYFSNERQGDQRDLGFINNTGQSNINLSAPSIPFATILCFAIFIFSFIYVLIHPDSPFTYEIILPGIGILITGFIYWHICNKAILKKRQSADTDKGDGGF